MRTVFVDAEACPVRAEAERVAERVAARHGAAVVDVSNGEIRPSGAAPARMVCVVRGADAVDRWIAAAVGPGDVGVTADLRLAAHDLAADLHAADPFRRGAGRAFGPADRSRFLDALDRALQGR